MSGNPETGPRLGFVGLGNMGRPIAARLVRGGVRIAVFDARPDAVRAFVAEHGGEAAPSLAALGRASDLVITMLPTTDVVRRVVLGAGRGDDDRLLGGLAAGTVLVDMGSSSPTATQALGAELAGHGVTMLDAPVSGGVGRAAEGTLAMMVGGDPAVIARCRPLFAHVATQVFVVGPLGAGHAMKALNNLVSAAGLVAVAEALLIGRRFGLDPTVMLDVLNASTGRNNATENKIAQFVFPRTYASGFSLALMVKDLATALELAVDTGTPAPLGGECRTLWARAHAELEPGADHTEIVRWLERLAGTTLTEA